MGIFENLPYANLHELNLDWLLKKVKALEDSNISTMQPQHIDAVDGSKSQLVDGGSWLYKYGRLVTLHLRIQITDASNISTAILLSNLPQPNDEHNYSLIAWAHHDSYSMIIPVVLRLNANGTLEYDGEERVNPTTTYAIADNDIIVLDLTYIAKE